MDLPRATCVNSETIVNLVDNLSVLHVIQMFTILSCCFSLP